MEETILVTMSDQERMNYRELLQNAFDVCHDPETSLVDRAASFLFTTWACSFPCNGFGLNVNLLNVDAVERLTRMMMIENRLCGGPCMGNPVNILMSCDHDSCFSCVDVFNGLINPFPNQPLCPTCLQYGSFIIQSSKFLQVLERVDILLRFGGFKCSKIIILHDECDLIHRYLDSGLRGLNIPFFSYGGNSNPNSVRLFIQSDTRVILLPIQALNENENHRYYFPPNTQLLITFGISREKKRFILNHILTYGEDEDNLHLNMFVARNTIEEVIMGTNIAEYNVDVMRDLITIASLLPDA